MIAIIDYGVGNLHSVQKAVEFIGGSAIVTNNADEIISSDKVILPGVGAFKDGMDGLRERKLISVLLDFAATGKPLIGICLGMQLMFDEGEEQGLHKGLGLVNGRVLPFEEPGIKIPQIGWNSIEVNSDSPLFYNINSGEYVYFNHSFYCVPEKKENIISTSEYGIKFSSSINRDNIFGVQFHPEKSQKVGLQILRNFVESIQ